MISPLLVVKRVAQGNDAVAMVVASFNISRSNNGPRQSRNRRSIRFYHSQADSDIEQEMRGDDNESSSKRISYDLVSHDSYGISRCSNSEHKKYIGACVIFELYYQRNAGINYRLTFQILIPSQFDSRLNKHKISDCRDALGAAIDCLSV